MDQIESGAGPALAAHSKDGSAKGPNPASSATAAPQTGFAEGAADTVGRISGQARDAARRAAASVGEAASSTRQRFSDQGGRAIDEAADFVRDQPVIALAATGALCFVLGLVLGRR